MKSAASLFYDTCWFLITSLRILTPDVLRRYMLGFSVERCQHFEREEEQIARCAPLP